MAKGFVTALTILDLSAAFDTIDHPILLDWFSSIMHRPSGTLYFVAIEIAP